METSEKKSGSWVVLKFYWILGSPAGFKTLFVNFFNNIFFMKEGQYTIKQKGGGGGLWYSKKLK